MTNRIVICADGTWNRPEKDISKDYPTNVLKFARAIKPVSGNTKQQVFYDWGVGSYYDPVGGGVTGLGIRKNIMDCYRYIVQNYENGDELFFFGFSRGAYTVRALCGLINNCGILKREFANRIELAFELYKKAGPLSKPDGEKSKKFRKKYSHESREVKFVGVWDTVGALGIPISFLGLFEDKDEFYDSKIGANVKIARHALAIDEQRYDFEPTIWTPNNVTDIKQMWFCGVHCDVGGGYKTENGLSTSLFPLEWIADEAKLAKLAFEPYWIQVPTMTALPKLHDSRRHFYRLRRKHIRQIDHGKGQVLLHSSVKARWDNDSDYRPENLEEYIKKNGW